MKSVRAFTVFAVLAMPAACGGDDEEEHDFSTYLECYEHHHDEEGLNDVGAMTECDAFFELSHDDGADCQADHEADVGSGVPQAAIDAHCDAEFPPA